MLEYCYETCPEGRREGKLVWWARLAASKDTVHLNIDFTGSYPMGEPND